MFISRVFTYPHAPYGFEQYKQRYLYANFPELTLALNISRPFQLGLIPHAFDKRDLCISWGGIINLDRISQQYYMK